MILVEMVTDVEDAGLFDNGGMLSKIRPLAPYNNIEQLTNNLTLKMLMLADAQDPAKF